jgi:hypothetical protein
MASTPSVAADGTVLTDELVTELAAEAEAGLADVELSPEPPPWHHKEPRAAGGPCASPGAYP